MQSSPQHQTSFGVSKKKVSNTEEAAAESFDSPASGESAPSGEKTDEKTGGERRAERHPRPEEFAEMLGGALRGDRLATVLFHLDDCPECRRNLPPLSPERLLEAVFGKEDF